MQNEYYYRDLGNERGFEVDENVVEIVEYASFIELVEKEQCEVN